MEYNDKYNDDIIKYIIKNKSKFRYSIIDVISFTENSYHISIIKTSNNKYNIYIKFNGKNVHNFRIEKNDNYYDDIKSIIEPLISKQSDDLSNEKILVKMLGKDSRYNKLKKIRKRN